MFFRTTTNMDLMIDKLSSLMVERGVRLRFLDYYYHLKYDNDDREWGNPSGCPISVRENILLA